MPKLIHLIAAILFTAFVLFPGFLLAWLAVGFEGAFLYTLHEEISEGKDPAKADKLVLIVGAAITIAFSLVGLVYGLMALSAVVIALALRRILPQRFVAA